MILHQYFCVCWKWTKFVRSLKLLFSEGIVHVSDTHAAIFNALVIDQYNTAGFSYKDGDDLPFGWEDEVDYRSRLLDLVFPLIEGLGVRAAQDRGRLKTTLQKIHAQLGGENERILSSEKVNVAKSYFNCIQSLVGIGRCTLRFLPSDEYTAEIGGILFRAVVSSCINSQINNDAQGTYVVKDKKLSLIACRRYSDMIMDGSNLHQRRYTDAEFFLNDCDMGIIASDPIARQIFLSAPPQDLLNVVRGLFLRQMVDTSYSGCGYGDFHLLCHLPITPFDPLLYEHSANFPENEEDQINYLSPSESNPNDNDSLTVRACCVLALYFCVSSRVN